MSSKKVKPTKKTKKAIKAQKTAKKSGSEALGDEAVSFELFGREDELLSLRACIRSNRNVLIEGPVGVGKTHLALFVSNELGRPVFRIDGDNRYSEQKMSGWFDPPSVLKNGFSEKSFFPGPLVQAMREGGVLFINELNRLPEGVQNVLLPAIDEKMILVPRLGEIRAEPGFQVIATQNPKEFVATSHLSEAILDRFDLIFLDYQSMEEEIQIVDSKLLDSSEKISKAAVRIARMTRVHPRVKRGASVRAAIGIAELTQSLMVDQLSFSEAFTRAVHLALPTRIEIERVSDGGESEDQSELISEWISEALNKIDSSEDPAGKKKT